jgi:hypothetical protein
MRIYKDSQEPQRALARVLIEKETPIENSSALVIVGVVVVVVVKVVQLGLFWKYTAE